MDLDFRNDSLGIGESLTAPLSPQTQSQILLALLILITLAIGLYFLNSYMSSTRSKTPPFNSVFVMSDTQGRKAYVVIGAKDGDTVSYALVDVVEDVLDYDGAKILSYDAGNLLVLPYSANATAPEGDSGIFIRKNPQGTWLWGTRVKGQEQAVPLDILDTHSIHGNTRSGKQFSIDHTGDAWIVRLDRDTVNFN